MRMQRRTSFRGRLIRCLAEWLEFGCRDHGGLFRLGVFVLLRFGEGGLLLDRLLSFQISFRIKVKSLFLF
mgnify:CR=1 FL=1